MEQIITANAQGLILVLPYIWYLEDIHKFHVIGVVQDEKSKVASWV